MKTHRTVISIMLMAAPGFVFAAERKGSGTQDNTQASSAESTKATLPPANQGVGTIDLLTTRDINQEIAEAASLSASGRDVRVATYRGRVILRGVVESAEEKRRLEEIAARRAGTGNVQSELQIK